MPDYRLFFDATALSAHHLQGKPQIVVISKWIAGKVGHGAKAQKKPVLYFKDRTLPLAVNKTNGAIIAALYGRNLDGWIGKAIEIFPTTTQFGKDIVDCIRVTPKIPTGKVSTEDPQPDPVADQNAASDDEPAHEVGA
jgi:hypothetical protein